MTQDELSLSRRAALVLSAGGGAAALTATAQAADGTKIGAHQDPGNCSTPQSAVANTQYGKVRGYLDGGVFTFKGVRIRAAPIAGFPPSPPHRGKASDIL